MSDLPNINPEKKDNIDNVLSYILLKKLLLPINKTNAYDLELVDSTGKQIKEPETDEEKLAYSSLDKLIFKLKRELGGKLNRFNSFMYVKLFDDNFYTNMIISGSLSKKGIIQKIKRDIEVKLEHNDIDFDGFMKVLMLENIKKQDIEKL